LLCRQRGAGKSNKRLEGQNKRSEKKQMGNEIEGQKEVSTKPGWDGGGPSEANHHQQTKKKTNPKNHQKKKNKKKKKKQKQKKSPQGAVGWIAGEKKVGKATERSLGREKREERGGKKKKSSGRQSDQHGEVQKKREYRQSGVAMKRQ